MNDFSHLKNKNILIFDTETTGVPIKKSGLGIDSYCDFTDNSKYDNSRIVQIAWVYIENFTIEKMKSQKINCYIRKPNDFDTISNSNFHGITIEIANKKGKHLSKIINKLGLGMALKNADYIIGHNIAFDICILANELHRLNFLNKLKNICDIVKNNKFICTGELGINICKLSNGVIPMYGYKMPKLKELYFHYFKKFPERETAQYNIKTLIDILEKII